MTPRRYHDLTFDADCLSATREDGEALRFTRRERAVLGAFLDRPQQLLSRWDLLDAIGSDTGDRNVDFIINRLRRKLRDAGPERRFIQTQYGEGYVWVASVRDPPRDAGLLVIGPIRGMEEPEAIRRLEPLRAALQALRPDRLIEISPGGRPEGPFEFSVEVILQPDGVRDEAAAAALVLRTGGGAEVAASFRATLHDNATSAANAELAGQIYTAVWRWLALGPGRAVTPNDVPLQLRMQHAGMALDPPGATWLASGEQVARLRERDPADPSAALLWGMHLFFTTVLDLGKEPLDAVRMAAIESEIEACVLPHLTAARADPMLALAAAKLLLATHRGYTDLAHELAADAFAGSGAYGAALPMLGQVRAYRGDLDGGVALYDQALQFCESGSEFEVYILFLKATALMAADDRPGVEAVFRRLIEVKPATRDQLGLFFLPPTDEGLGHALADLADRADLQRARKVVAYQHFMIARFFPGRPDHAANVLHGPLSHLVRRFGPQVCSDNLWALVPASLRRLNAALRRPVRR